jgi:hypothetical protein
MVKMQYMYIHHVVFTLWNPASLQCLLHCKIVKPGHTVADSYKFIVGLRKMYSDKIKMLNCKIKLLNIACLHKVCQLHDNVDLMELHISAGMVNLAA